MIPYSRHSVNWRDAIAVAWQIRTKSLTQGDRISQFEKVVAEYVGAKFAVAVSSATAGLHLSMLALEIPKGAAVATPPITFVSTANSIVYSELDPIFIDIDEKSLNISPTIFERSCAANPKIKAVIPVHFAGLACEMERIHKIAKNFGVKIIEDAAHALGGTYSSGERIGSCKYSDLTVFSFHAVKSITTGEGGLITTNNEDLYKKLLLLRSHGITKNKIDFKNDLLSTTNKKINQWYYEMQTLGFHYRITEIQAVLGISQMKRINKFLSKRLRLVNKYEKEFSKTNLINPSQSYSKVGSGNHIYPINIDFDKIKICRNQLIEELGAKGMATQIHYIPIPLQPFYSSKGFNMTELPNAMNYYFKTLTLPLHAKLSRRAQIKVIRSLRNVIDKNLL